MQKNILLTGVLALLVSSSARADLISAQIKDSVGNPSAVTTTAGSFFDVFVELDFPQTGLSTAQFKLRSSVAGYFQLESVSFGAGWSSDSLDVLDPSADPLDPDTGDIGSIATDLTNGVTGVHTFATLHIAVLGAATPGSYTLSLQDMAFGDMNFDPVPATTNDGYVVTVAAIPSPTSAVLALVALPVLARRRRVG